MNRELDRWQGQLDQSDLDGPVYPFIRHYEAVAGFLMFAFMIITIVCVVLFVLSWGMSG